MVNSEVTPQDLERLKFYRRVMGLDKARGSRVSERVKVLRKMYGVATRRYGKEKAYEEIHKLLFQVYGYTSLKRCTLNQLYYLHSHLKGRRIYRGFVVNWGSLHSISELVPRQKKELEKWVKKSARSAAR